MPRTNRATGRDYASRPPRAHPDARQRPPTPPVTTVVEPPRADEGAPPSFQIVRHTHVPGGTAIQWVKRVDRVIQNAHNIRMFEGDYHRLAHGRIYARPGNLFLISVKDRRDVERVCLYLYLPDDIWYNTGMPSIVRIQGWHRIVRNYADGWAVLSSVQRVVRACNEAQIMLQNALQAATIRAGSVAVSDGPETERTRTAIAHFRDISEQAAGNITELTADSVRRSFRAWADGVAQATAADYDTVVTALSDALTEPTPHTGGTLEDTLRELAAWIPDRDLGDLENDDMDTVTQICDNVRTGIRDERRMREWQFRVLRRLGMTRGRAQDACNDRSLTEIFVGQHHETAVNYLDRFYDFRKTTPEAVDQALTAVADASQATKRRDRPSTDNRLARNIRIGRNRDG